MSAPDTLPEARNNRLLRRADWRFLLPNPHPRRTRCFAGRMLKQAVALVSGDVVSSADGECDLAVAVNPDGATLTAAAEALQQGGSCYTEWYSPLFGGAAGVRRRLERAGFTDVSCYWPWPPPATGRTRFWLPLEAPGTLAAFIRNEPPARAKTLRARRVIRNGVWRLVLRLGLTLPICAIARKPGQSARDDLLETIRSDWNAWNLGPQPDRLARILLTKGSRSIGKVVVVVTAEPDGGPRLIVKMPRVPESVPNLLNETATLRDLQSLRPAGVSGVPRVLFCREHGDHFALGESAVTGWPAFWRLDPVTYAELATSATNWLTQLVRDLSPQPPSVWWDRLIAPVLADFAASYGAILEPDAMRQAEAILATLGPLPVVCEHRDFSPWNVLVAADGHLGVLDWESAEPHGLPALDLLYFLTYTAFFLDGATTPERHRTSYRDALDPTTFTGRVRRDCLDRYARTLGLDPAAISPLGLLVWMIHARSEYRRFLADAGAEPPRDTLRQSLFVQLWHEELRNLQSRG